jgi:hypothetical protein
MEPPEDLAKLINEAVKEARQTCLEITLLEFKRWRNIPSDNDTLTTLAIGACGACANIATKILEM